MATIEEKHVAKATRKTPNKDEIDLGLSSMGQTQE